MTFVGILFVAMGLKVLFGDSPDTPTPRQSFTGWLFGLEDVPEAKERAVRFSEDAWAWFQGKTTNAP